MGAASVAFPSISTGVYGYPLAEATEGSVEALRSADTKVDFCLLVAFDDRTAEHWERAVAQRSA